MLKQWQYCDLIYVVTEDKKEIVKARIIGSNIDTYRHIIIHYSPCSNHNISYAIDNEYCFATEAEALLYLKSKKEKDLAFAIEEIDSYTASKANLEQQISDIEDRLTELGLCIN